MSDENEEIINEEDPVSNILNPKTAIIMAIFLIVVVIIGFVVSFINFQVSTNKGEHSKYFWVELNIPKGYPDTVYQEKIVYIDSNEVRERDSVQKSMAPHDTVKINAPQAAQPQSPPVSQAPLPSAPPVRNNTRPASPVHNTVGSAPANTDEQHHLADEDKGAIIAQIEALKKANNIASNDIEVAHVYHTNAGVFITELMDYLRSKGYNPDDGNGSRMIFGNTSRRGWWVNVKPETKKIMIGVGMF